MTAPLAFPDLLDLIDGRSAALRKAVADAPDPGAQVPSCPGWTLVDLLDHLAGVHLFWAAAVTAGAGFTPVAPELAEGLAFGEALARAEEATEALLAALREAGPDRACWTWWSSDEVASDSRAVARHQVQEVAVHAHDAELAVGAPRPVPAVAALDGLDEFPALYWGSADPWPHGPATVRLRAAEGLERTVELAPGAAPELLELTGTASELLLVLHRRRPAGALLTAGSPALLDHLLAWPRLG
ncbi:maleylpyruvate isomerase family mycothiol-dependent enzyme [Kitasatospora saccharophila]|uniref:Maleylpyruvate isomerase family mycothiol-dependent enzyme n=1 Tax=Kitasatospora saccharophila TaxID=407973 RepID=A0ABN2WFB1_9ACTN